MSSVSLQTNLRIIGTPERIRGYYQRGEFFTIKMVHTCLLSLENIKTAGKTMKSNIESVISDEFLHVPLEFPVYALQHVTSQAGARQILDSQSFKGREHERPEFNGLFFWSADISSDDIQKAHHQAYETMRSMVNAEDIETFHEEMMEQFANSPAFDKSASRYGNFKFSFPLSVLLSRYKTQHCKGREPQLRILGTDIYKQEIAHYILVHSPNIDTENFNELPLVLNKPNRSHNPYVVSWMDETLYWRPESTSSSLLLSISGNSCSDRSCDLQEESRPFRKERPYVPRCVWNHLVLAFYLPNNRELKIPHHYLLRNLTPCHALQPFLKEHPIQKYQAREVIRKYKKKMKRSSLDCRTQVSPKRKTYEKKSQKMKQNHRR
ncbi:uncharacterized protein LOC120991852 [Bufo bufo]|uniref:uncharacterized protein LOC120991852 n=1 Tax=Bufo bufo TaxID=8384 RepID=UPI001ABDD19A|nr:uncharacterized protein LOC120991852 [Bufo bufo]